MNKKILVVDDELDVIKVLEARLRENKYDVAVALNGEDALSKVKQYRPDLIILDIIMPGMGGNEVAAELNKITGGAKIPIIFLSALIDKEEEGSSKTKKNYFIFSKPFNIKGLLVKIEEFLGN